MSALAQAVDRLACEAELDIRTLRPDEGARYGLDAEWVWVAAREGAFIAQLIASPCHGKVMILRVQAKPEQGIALGLLFRKFVRDIEARGFQEYFTWLDPTRPEEAQLLSVLRRAGCEQLMDVQVAVRGKISELRRW